MRRAPPTFAEFFAGERTLVPFTRAEVAVATMALALRARIDNPSPATAANPFAILEGVDRAQARWDEGVARGLTAAKARYERTLRLADLDVTLLPDGRLFPFKRRGSKTRSRLAPATLPDDEERIWFVDGLDGRAAYEGALRDLALVEGAGCEGFTTQAARGADWAAVRRLGYGAESDLRGLRGVVDHLVAVFHPVGWEGEIHTRAEPTPASAVLRAARRRAVPAALERLDALLAATGAPEGLLDATFPKIRP